MGSNASCHCQPPLPVRPSSRRFSSVTVITTSAGLTPRAARRLTSHAFPSTDWRAQASIGRWSVSSQVRNDRTSACGNARVCVVDRDATQRLRACLLPGPRAGVAHAELVALRVGHDHPPAAVLSSGVLLDAARADSFETFDLYVDVGCLDVEVHTVLGELGFADSLQEELGQRP